MSEKKDKTKADSQYYFFKSTPEDLAKNYVPKKIDPNAAPPLTTSRAPIKTGGSKWNTIGTWCDQTTI